MHWKLGNQARDFRLKVYEFFCANLAAGRYLGFQDFLSFHLRCLDGNLLLTGHSDTDEDTQSQCDGGSAPDPDFFPFAHLVPPKERSIVRVRNRKSFRTSTKMAYLQHVTARA